MPSKGKFSSLFLKIIKIERLELSHKGLYRLKAIDSSGITELGKILAYIPLAPKYAKLLLICRKEGILGYGLLIVSALSTEEIFDINADK